MTHPQRLYLYLAALTAASFLTSPPWLLVAALVLIALCGRDAPRLLKRALAATALFSGTVSLVYLAISHWQGRPLPWEWLVSVNLRVLLMTLLTFLFIARVNLFQALSFSRRLTFLLTLAVSQSLGLRRTLVEFRLGLQSRSIRHVTLRDRYRAAAHAVGWLLDRALANAHESAQALQARGFFK